MRRRAATRELERTQQGGCTAQSEHSTRRNAFKSACSYASQPWRSAYGAHQASGGVDPVDEGRVDRDAVDAALSGDERCGGAAVERDGPDRAVAQVGPIDAIDIERDRPRPRLAARNGDRRSACIAWSGH